MKQERSGLLCVEEHPLPFEVVIVALFWIIAPVMETLISGEGNRLSMLLPTEPERT